MLTYRIAYIHPQYFTSYVTAEGSWKKMDKHFCQFCNMTFETMSEAIVALDGVNNMVIYDMFCDGVGYFCVCPHNDIIEQTHKNGIDCLYSKSGKQRNSRSRNEEL